MWGRWKKYVPVGDRIEKGKKKMKKLEKAGKKIEPIEIQGRGIAKKFWGKQWCTHIENFSDYENRLPRGKTYARNGSICHLGIQEGAVEAFVCGSRVYETKVNITKLPLAQWKIIKKQCKGQIDSLLELLRGKLSDSVMQFVTDTDNGLLPKSDEITFSCSCPDWAEMCKHVAAVLYGIGNRLDENPDLLFLLRGVDPTDLISPLSIEEGEVTDDVVDSDELEDLFDIDLEEAIPKRKTSKKVTGAQLKKARTKAGLSAKALANSIGVTQASIYRWEKMKKLEGIHPKSFQLLKDFVK